MKWLKEKFDKFMDFIFDWFGEFLFPTLDISDCFDLGAPSKKSKSDDKKSHT